MVRNNRITIRVTSEEKSEIVDKAKNLGFDDLTSYVKWCLKEKIFQIQKMSCQSGIKN